MNYILIETSAAICSLALARDSEIICSFCNDQPMSHATSLPVFVQKALEMTRQQGMSIDIVAVSGGPGSYTGLRIGISTAKGLCYATGARLVQVGTLQLIARRFLATHDKTASAQFYVRPMIDARRMEVYTQAFDSDGLPSDDAQALIISPELFADTPETIYICGSGAAKCHDVLTSDKVIIADDIEPMADAQMLMLARKAVEERCFQDVAYYEPFYLKEFYTTAKPMQNG